MEKTNIVFLIIDSFRSDKFFGNTKNIKNYTFNNLINNGFNCS